MRAGLPTTTACGGTERVTTAPAPTIAPVPISMPGRIVAFAPIEAPSWTIVRGYSSSHWRLRGIGSLVKVAFGPTKTSSSSTIPSQSCTPHLTVTRSPTTAPPSTNTPSQMLQSAPTCAPSRTCAKAHTRVPSPTSLLSQRPCSCMKTSLIPVRPRKGGHVADDRAGATLHGFVCTPHVGPDYSQPDQVDAAEENDQEHSCGIAGHGDRPRDLGDDHRHGEHGAQRQPEEADQPQRPHRQVREGKDAVGEVAELAPEGPSARPRARPAVVGDHFPPETDPEELGDERGVNGLQRADDVAHGGGASEDVDSAGRDLAHDEAAVEVPVQARSGVAAIVAAGSFPDDHVDLAAREPAEELDHELRRLLEIGCHHRDVPAARSAHAGSDRGEGAEVTGMVDDLSRDRAAGQGCEQLLPRIVGAAINDKDGLEPPFDLRLDSFDRLQKRLDRAAVAVDRYHQ